MYTPSRKTGGTFIRVPALLAKNIDPDHIAVRFEQIGDRNRFRRILQQFRSDFILADCREIEGQPWWFISSQQRNELMEFCRRNALTLKAL